MSLRKKILIISFSDLSRDPRVYRQIRFLQEDYEITAAGLAKADIEDVTYIPISCQRESFTKRWRNRLKLKIKRYDAYYWSLSIVQKAYSLLRDRSFDLILANDMQTLPLSLRLAEPSGAKVLFDAHEYEPLLYNDNWMFNFFYKDYWDTVCRQYLPQADAMTTVCVGLAEEYEKNYGVRCEVITSAPFYEELSPSPVNADRIRMIHHGGPHPSRKIENMIQLMDLLDERFTLDLMLVNTLPRYYHKLREMSRSHDRIQWHEPVPMPQIAEALNTYDIGLYLMPPTSFNQKMSLPNKLFEFIQARLAVAIWPSPEMARAVREHDCGVVADDFTVGAMAAKLNSLSREDIMRYKQNAHQAATVCCAETNREILLQIVKQILS